MKGNIQSLERSARRIRMALEGEGVLVHPYKPNQYKIKYPANNFSFMLEEGEDSIEESNTIQRNRDRIMLDRVKEGIYFFRYLGFSQDSVNKFVNFLAENTLAEYLFKVRVREAIADSYQTILTGVDLYVEGEDFPSIRTNDWSSWDGKWIHLGKGMYLATVFFSSDLEFE